MGSVKNPTQGPLCYRGSRAPCFGLAAHHFSVLVQSNSAHPFSFSAAWTRIPTFGSGSPFDLVNLVLSAELNRSLQRITNQPDSFNRNTFLHFSDLRHGGKRMDGSRISRAQRNKASASIKLNRMCCDLPPSSSGEDVAIH
ncbi:hypothetical protein EYF80_010287 [Liparis tanakae]|uniref:Uncharacterized protein n=1 Tax=Liparis tanakae TaxID=230148 RepID=A0A4Z2IQN3_9TELE|nr:hypothetical protein EYF80_010287 [Liparis tanakae]